VAAWLCLKKASVVLFLLFLKLSSTSSRLSRSCLHRVGANAFYILHEWPSKNITSQHARTDDLGIVWWASFQLVVSKPGMIVDDFYRGDSVPLVKRILQSAVGVSRLSLLDGGNTFGNSLAWSAPTIRFKSSSSNPNSFAKWCADGQKRVCPSLRPAINVQSPSVFSINGLPHLWVWMYSNLPDKK